MIKKHSNQDSLVYKTLVPLIEKTPTIRTAKKTPPRSHPLPEFEQQIIRLMNEAREKWTGTSTFQELPEYILAMENIAREATRHAKDAKLTHHVRGIPPPPPKEI